MRAFDKKPKTAQETIFRNRNKQPLSASPSALVEEVPDTLQIASVHHDFSRIPVNAKLTGNTTQRWTVNMPGDVYEQEADRIVEQVMAKPAHFVPSPTPTAIQRSSTQPYADMFVAPAGIKQVLASPGESLAPGLRQDMERRFGHDFSRVRIFSGTAAEQSALELNAHAYTVGHNIVFGAGHYAPGTYTGRRLIAHELTHVLQQSTSASNLPQVQRDGPKPVTAAEKLQVVKDKLKAKYGLKEISEHNGVAWTESELKKIDAAFSKMSPEEQKRLQGVTLVLTDKIPSIKRKGRTIPIAGQTFGTFQVELTRAGVNKTTPIHEAGHLIHNTAIANAEKIFERSQFKVDLETARLMFSVAVQKAPKTFSGNAEQTASLKQFNTGLDQVTTAASVFERSGNDDLKTNRAALEQAVQDLELYRYPVEGFGSEPGAKALLALADVQSTFVAALLLWSDEKEKAVGPVKKLDEFVSIVKKHRLDRRGFDPFTPYAEANWPDYPMEFFAEAYQSWRNNPAYMKANGRALFDWFEKGGHLGPAAPPPRAPWKPINIPMPKLPKTLHDTAPVIEELLIEVGETFLPAVEGGLNLFPNPGDLGRE